MDKIKCLIVDDEDLAIDVIEEYIGRIDFLHLEAKCGSAIEALQILSNTKIDLLFLDIQMPGLTGIQLLRNLYNPPAVIFTTAYSEYAIEGFELEALDYLLKPISFERFIKAVNRYFKQKPDIRNTIKPEREISKQRAFIFLKADKRMIKIFLDEILFIESHRNYVSILLENAKEIKTLNTITNIEEKLPENKFLRIHRSFLIATDKINSYSSANIEIAGQSIPIGRNYKNIVLDFLDKDAID